MLEVEIKLHLGSDTNTFRNQIYNEGYRQSGIIYERNTLYDTPDMKLTNAGELLRLRYSGVQRYDTQKRELTFKGKNASDEKLVREELNVPFSGDMQTILESLGYVEIWQYRRWRTAYKHKNTNLGGIVYVDTFDKPAGIEDGYAEFEGWDAWIDDLAAKLGYTKDQYITKSYYELFK